MRIKNNGVVRAQAAGGGPHGLNIFYYGKGKGKTTAAMGLAVRAAGAGMHVFILQFVKAASPPPGIARSSGEWPVSSEIHFVEAANKLPKRWKTGRIHTEQCGLGFVGILGDKKEKRLHVQAAVSGLQHAQVIINSKKYSLVVLDELVSALELGLIKEKDILFLLKNKPKHLHLAYTGHDAFKRIIAVSDLVSEIKMIKHPYYQGILAQRGIDF